MKGMNTRKKVWVQGRSCSGVYFKRMRIVKRVGFLVPRKWQKGLLLGFRMPIKR